MPDLRCNGCRQRVGYTSRTQPVPVQCLDPFCAASAPTRQSEERDSFIEHLFHVAGISADRIGKLFGITRQGVGRVLR